MTIKTKPDFITEAANGMKIEKLILENGNKVFIVWHCGAPIKVYQRFTDALYYLNSF